jgi:PAB-dependent poly(A)-specific ribonuclease subunit 2
MFMGGIGPQTVKSIRVTDREVWTLTEGGIGGRKRGGMVKWSVTEPLRGLKTMAANPTNSHEVLAGGNNGVIVANTSRGEITRRVSVERYSLVRD